jgi:hypothetical protein
MNASEHLRAGRHQAQSRDLVVAAVDVAVRTGEIVASVAA